MHSDSAVAAGAAASAEFGRHPDIVPQTDASLVRAVGHLLRGGVLLATAVAAAGGVLFLRRHGAEAPRFSDFHGVPVSVSAVARALMSLRTDDGRVLMLAGLLVLIATPVVRVVVSFLDFTRERNWTYVALTALVLGVLATSMVQAY